MIDEKIANGKAAWKRCHQCGERVWNDPIDWEAHRNTKDPVCPAVLRQIIKRLAARIDELEKQPEAVVTELISSGPAIDFEAVEEDVEEDVEEEEPVEVGIFEEIVQAAGPEDPEEEQEVPDVLPRAEMYFEPAPRAIDRYDDDDDDDEGTVTVSRPVMR